MQDLCNLVFLHFPICAILGGVSCICGGSVTEGQLPRTAAREQMSLARMEMIFRVGGADDYDYYNIFRVGGADDYDYYNILERAEQTIIITI